MSKIKTGTTKKTKTMIIPEIVSIIPDSIDVNIGLIETAKSIVNEIETKSETVSAIPEITSVPVPIPEIKKTLKNDGSPDFTGVSFTYNDETVTVLHHFSGIKETYKSYFEIVSESFNLLSDSAKYDFLTSIDFAAVMIMMEPAEKNLITAYMKSLKTVHKITYETKSGNLKITLNRKSYDYMISKYSRIKSEKKSFPRTVLNIVKNIGNGLLKQDLLNMIETEIETGNDSPLTFFNGIIGNGDFTINAKNYQYILDSYSKLVNEFFETGIVKTGGKNWFIKGISYKLVPAHVLETGSPKYITFTDITSFRAAISKKMECQKNDFMKYIDFTSVQIKIGKNIETIEIGESK